MIESSIFAPIESWRFGLLIGAKLFVDPGTKYRWIASNRRCRGRLSKTRNRISPLPFIINPCPGFEFMLRHWCRQSLYNMAKRLNNML